MTKLNSKTQWAISFSKYNASFHKQLAFNPDNVNTLIVSCEIIYVNVICTTVNEILSKILTMRLNFDKNVW